MLSRTADSLYWLARYIERAENIARIVQVGHRMASTAGSLGQPGNEWHSTLVASGCAPRFYPNHPAAHTPAAIDSLVRHAGNSSSRLSAFDAPRRHPEGVGGAIDYSQWEAILRSVSALRSYHWVYHDRLKPWLIAELLILRSEMPRSLISCFEQITYYLALVANDYGGKRGECHRLAGEMHAKLRYGRIAQIMESGLHEFLTEHIDRSMGLGNAIRPLYLT